MRPRGLVLLPALAALLALPGCLGVPMPTKQRYVLDVARDGGQGAQCPCKLSVGHFRVAPLFERKGFVYRTGEAAYSNDFYNEFQLPPGILFRGAVVDWLEAAGLFEEVVEPRNAGQASWILEGLVQKLYGDFRDESPAKAVLEVEFTLLEVAPSGLETAFRKSYGTAARAETRDAEGLAHAWDAAVARVLTQLEADLRRELGLTLAHP